MSFFIKIRSHSQTLARLSVFILFSLLISSASPLKSKKNTTFFTLLSARETGLNFENPVTENRDENGLFSEDFYEGGGLAFVDLDGDRLPDLIFGSRDGKDRIFRNKGEFEFEEENRKADFREPAGRTAGICVGDFNADGQTDFYLSKFLSETKPSARRNRLYFKDGDFSFEEHPGGLGPADIWRSETALDLSSSFGRPAIYLLNRPPRPGAFSDDRRFIRPDTLYGPRLFLANAKGEFEDRSTEAGLTADFRAKAVCPLDPNADFFTDLLLALSEGKWAFYRQDSLHHFHLQEFKSGFERIEAFVPGDFYGLGKEEIAAIVRNGAAYFIAFFAFENEQLLLKNTYPLKVAAGNLIAGDFDSDGKTDLFIATGKTKDLTGPEAQAAFAPYLPGYLSDPYFEDFLREHYQEILAEIPAFSHENLLLLNAGNGKFEDASEAFLPKIRTGPGALALADADADGDRDLILHRSDGKPLVLRNDHPNKNLLKISVRDKNNLPVKHFTAEVFAGSLRQYSFVRSQSGKQGCSEPEAFFGFGEIRQVDSLILHLPDGRKRIKTKIKLPAFIDVPASEFSF